MSELDRLINVVQRGGFVVLDTETTGIYGDVEICQIAILSSTGETLLDTLVKPVNAIPLDAMRIHGITNEMVASAPSWLNINEQVWALLHGRTVITYNAEYDFRLIESSERLCGPIAFSDWDTIERQCAMLAYAEFYGDWNDYRGNFKWQKLTSAADDIGYALPSGIDAHSALGDCMMTLAVCQHMAGASV